MTFDLRHRLPTADELAKFDRWHVVAFAARCARRVQPIYHAMWPGAVLASGFIVEQAIRASLKPGSAAGDSARTASDADDYDYDDYVYVQIHEFHIKIAYEDCLLVHMVEEELDLV